MAPWVSGGRRTNRLRIVSLSYRAPLVPPANLRYSHVFMPQPASAQIEEGVIDVLKNVSRRPIEPTLASDLVADLGFDSLQVLEVIAELEDRFDISIPLNDVPATRTVAEVVAQVAQLVQARSNG